MGSAAAVGTNSATPDTTSLHTSVETGNPEPYKMNICDWDPAVAGVPKVSSVWSPVTFIMRALVLLLNDVTYGQVLSCAKVNPTLYKLASPGDRFSYASVKAPAVLNDAVGHTVTAKFVTRIVEIELEEALRGPAVQDPATAPCVPVVTENALSLNVAMNVSAYEDPPLVAHSGKTHTPTCPEEFVDIEYSALMLARAVFMV